MSMRAANRSDPAYLAISIPPQRCRGGRYQVRPRKSALKSVYHFVKCCRYNVQTGALSSNPLTLPETVLNFSNAAETGLGSPPKKEVRCYLLNYLCPGR